MQKKLYKVMTILVSCTVLFFLLVAGSLGYSTYQRFTKNELKSAAKLVAAGNNKPSEMADILERSVEYDVRVTFIDAHGSVKYDSEADPAKMENHSDREEFKEAMANGEGESTRFSKTLGYTTYYYAIKYNGGVLRFSTDKENLAGVFLAVIPMLVVFAGGIIFITTIISIKLSESMIKPINSLVKQLDLRNENIGQFETPYEELEPIIKNADVLMGRIHKNMNKIKAEREKISLITENMVEGMILLDEDMTVLSVNKSALKILGNSFDPTEHTKIDHMTNDQQIIGLLEEAKESGAAKGIITEKSRFYRTFANKVYSENTLDFGIIIFFVDVTEEIQSEQIRRDFSANVSHELKTPLTTIKGFGELLENGIFTKEEDVKKYGGMIYRESERLLYLINDIIRLSQIEEQEHVLSDKIDLLKTAHDVEEILRHKADNREVTMTIEGEPVQIYGNQSYITELFLNLMDNAIKYNHEGGSLKVTVGIEYGKAVAVFSDTGIGISDEHQSRIFERFYRVDKSRSKKIGGTGLGLSIVKHIVAYHSGEIQLESELEKGTTITVKLPFNEPETQQAEGTAVTE
ncbi:ATP-binding protein [Ruminococcus bicirculans (ex Wegman et al. 2014)]|uniref:ATP-binding protein n=1 Tax=Ruminococcus bicirculans (ex Wegman et al. 2014) TaxID=1160721 RepID=UPI00266D28CD|nr:ATP-binding protein [uncultured Ruminococcus sp.]